MRQFTTLPLLAAAVVIFSALSVHAEKAFNFYCMSAFNDFPKTGAFRIQTSGRQHDVASDIERATQELGDVATALGYTPHEHLLEFATSEDLSRQVTVGGHASPHWIDGQKVIYDAPGLAGVMEFVVGGCKSCRSFYRDTTELKGQYGIIAHVYGHNDFGKNSKFKDDKYDPVGAAYDLAQMMKELHENYDVDSVDRFRQLLETFTKSGLDYAYGSLETPDQLQRISKKIGELTPLLVPRSDKQPPQEITNRTSVWPEKPTASIMSAMIANMPSFTDEWKKKMAQLLLEANSQYPGNVQTKIMNEGWATFSQFFLPKWTSLSSDDDLARMGSLIPHVIGHNAIGNPYWLGLSSWMHLYKKFLKRPDIAAIPYEWERDRLWVEEAHRLMRQYRDYQFLRYALDDDWVHKHGLFLHRKITAQDVEAGKATWENFYEGDTVVLSTNRERLITHISRKVSDRTQSFPSLDLHDINFKKKSVLLRQKSDPEIPLEKFSTAQTAFAMSQVFDKPVTVDFLGSSTWAYLDDSEKHDFGMGPTGRHVFPGMFDQHSFTRVSVPDLNWVRIEVAPDGIVHAWIYEHAAQPDEGGTFVYSQRISQLLQQGVIFYADDFLMDIDFTQENPDIDHVFPNDPPTKLLTTMRNAITLNNNSVVDKAPTAYPAVEAFHRKVKQRLAGALASALAGKRPVKMGASSVSFRALPIIPTFRFDHNWATAFNRHAFENNPAPIDRHQSGDYWPADADDVGVALRFNGSVLPGDIIPAHDPHQDDGHGHDHGEEGDGDEGEPAPGEQGDLEAPPMPAPESDDPEEAQDFGDGPGDGADVSIPRDLWDDLALGRLELPNPREEVGGSVTVNGFELDGLKRADDQNLLEDRMIEDAIELGINMNPDALLPKEGDTPSDTYKRFVKILEDGLAQLDPEDYPVRDKEPVVQPDSRAVVVFVIDLTGSQLGEAQEVSKLFVAQVMKFIRKYYNDVDVRFVGYDDTAEEYSEEDIFKAGRGGGNKDSTGFIKADEILEDYDDTWSKYVYGLGDGGSNDTQATIQAMESLYKQVQHMAWILNKTNSWFSTEGEFNAAIKKFAEENKWMDMTEMEGRSGVYPAMQSLFSPEANQKRAQKPGK